MISRISVTKEVSPAGTVKLSRLPQSTVTYSEDAQSLRNWFLILDSRKPICSYKVGDEKI